MSKKTSTFPDLRSIRKGQGETETLAKWAGELDMSPSELSNIERGFFTRISLDKALRVASRYRVPVESLVKAA